MENVGGYIKALMQEGILEKVKIKTELRIVWITSDGSKFLTKEKAELHQKEVLNKVDDLVIDHESQQEKEVIRKWRQTKAKQRAIDLKEKLWKQ
tara:strand:+ start:230 stop:511 length:282 start_codon:yes stop_codon:yes gene_type:complete